MVAIFGAICNSIMVANNWGRHIEFLSDENLSTNLQWVTYAVIQTCLFNPTFLGEQY